MTYDPAVWFQVSRGARMVARLPEGKTGVDALAAASGDRAWAKFLGERSAGDQYLRVYASTVRLTAEEFAQFRREGGGIYLPNTCPRCDRCHPETPAECPDPEPCRICGGDREEEGICGRCEVADLDEDRGDDHAEDYNEEGT